MSSCFSPRGGLSSFAWARGAYALVSSSASEIANRMDRPIIEHTVVGLPYARLEGVMISNCHDADQIAGDTKKWVDIHMR